MSGFKKKNNENKRLFLLSFFENEEGYEEKQINENWWLVKHWDRGRQIWKVHIFSKESYENYLKPKGGFNF